MRFLTPFAFTCLQRGLVFILKCQALNTNHDLSTEVSAYWHIEEECYRARDSLCLEEGRNWPADLSSVYSMSNVRSAEALVDVVGRDDVRVSHVVGEVVGQVDLAQLRLRSLVVEAQLLVYRLRRDGNSS